MPADCKKLLSFDRLDDVDENPRIAFYEMAIIWTYRKQAGAVMLTGASQGSKGNLPCLC